MDITRKGDAKMIKIKILVALSTLLVGLFYTRNELKLLINHFRKKDFVSWYELNKIVANRESSLY
jgi:hypothetical protein